MTTNPYEAPASDITLENTANTTSGDYLYRVSRIKFFTLYIATLGIYAIYWSYKNWAIAKKKRKLSIWPVMRGLFLIFFLHSLMRRVTAMAKRKKIALNYSCQTYATLGVILMIIDSIVNRLVQKDIGYPVTDILGFLILFASSANFWAMQNVINIASGDKLGASNEKFTVANILWIILGIGWWILLIIIYVQIITEGEIS